jgi:hypothetical protein
MKTTTLISITALAFAVTAGAATAAPVSGSSLGLAAPSTSAVELAAHKPHHKFFKKRHKHKHHRHHRHNRKHHH